MRRIIVLLACLTVLLAWALPAVAGPFTDVPTDHWAYDAIDKLQAEGFVEGYPDGTFRGNRSFTRYEMAMVVARIWDRLYSELQTLEGQMEAMYMPDEAITRAELEDELALVYDLMDEFSAELENLGVRVDDLESRMSSAEDRISNLEKFLDTIQFSGCMRSRIEDIITNEYGDAADTQGTRPGDMFEFEEMVMLALDAHPSDYLDVYMNLLQVASYLDSPVGEDFTYDPGYYVAPARNAKLNQSLVIDEAWAKADMMKLMGWNPSALFNRFNLVVGRQYARFGEFGLAFDNGYETRPGVYIDLGGKRIEAAAFLARSSRLGRQEGLGVGRLSYAIGDSRSEVAPRDYFAKIGFNYLATGVGNERGMGVDLDTELLSEVYLNRLRVEWFQLQRDQLGYDVGSYGDEFENSLIAWVDLYNDGNTRVSAAFADIGLVPGFSAIDNDPFEEYDALYAGRGDNYNYAYESGLNPFPSDFVGAGMQVEHTWWDVLDTRVTFYDGTNQDEEDFPVVIRLNIRYPLSDASDIALEYIHSGIDALTLAKLRGEFLVRF
jgi:hypothetical protein